MEGEGFLSPGGFHDLKEFVEAAAAFLEGYVEALVDVGEGTPAHAQLNPPVADVVQRRHFLGNADGMAQRQAVHRRADPHRVGLGGNGGGDHYGRRQHPLHVEVVLSQPAGGNAQVLCFLHQSERLGECVVVVAVNGARKLKEQSKFHISSPLAILTASFPRQSYASADPQ